MGYKNFFANNILVNESKMNTVWGTHHSNNNSKNFVIHVQGDNAFQSIT